MYYYIKKSIIFAKISDCEFAQFATRVRPLESSIIVGNLRGNCRSASASRLLPSNFSATDPARISPFGDEVARFSAARQSAYLGTNAFTSPGSFGCACAALRNICFDFAPCPRLAPPQKKYRHCRYPLHSTVMKSPVIRITVTQTDVSVDQDGSPVMKSPVIRITVTPCLSPYPDHHAPFRSHR